MKKDRGQTITPGGEGVVRCKRCNRSLINPNPNNPYLCFGYGAVCGRRSGIDKTTGQPSIQELKKIRPRERSILPTKGEVRRMKYTPRYNPTAKGWCYISQVTDEHGIRHVLFVEPNNNTGMSITNASEDVATQYIHSILGVNNFDPSRVRFFESYENGGIAEGGIDRIFYTWEQVSENQKKYGMPWCGYPGGIEIVAYHPDWAPGNREDEERFGLPPRMIKKEE